MKRNEHRRITIGNPEFSKHPFKLIGNRFSVHHFARGQHGPDQRGRLVSRHAAIAKDRQLSAREMYALNPAGSQGISFFSCKSKFLSVIYLSQGASTWMKRFFLHYSYIHRSHPSTSKN